MEYQVIICFECEVDSDEEPEGWGLGLDANGQAHYGCQNCRVLLFNVFDTDPKLA